MAENRRVISMESRVPELKKYRRKKLLRHLTILVSFFALLILITVYFLSPLSKLSVIYVEGNKQLTEQDVKDQSDLEIGEYIFAINKKQVAAHLKKNKLVKKATVTQQGLNRIQLHIEEYQTIGYEQKDGSYYDILENGILLKNQSRKFPIGNSLLFKNFQNGSLLKSLIKEVGQLPDDVRESISEIIYEPTKTDKKHIHLFMNDGNQVQATIYSFADKMKHYPQIVSQLQEGQKGTIDLEVGTIFESYYQQNKQKKKK